MYALAHMYAANTVRDLADECNECLLQYTIIQKKLTLK